MTNDFESDNYDPLNSFYENKEAENKQESSQLVEKTAPTDNKTTDNIKNVTLEPELFKSRETFADLENYFKESFDLLNDIFSNIGDGRIRADLTFEEREKYIKRLDQYKDNMIETVQKATLRLSEDITNVKRIKVKSNVTTDGIKELVYGSPNFKAPYEVENNIFDDPK